MSDLGQNKSINAVSTNIMLEPWYRSPLNVGNNNMTFSMALDSNSYAWAWGQNNAPNYSLGFNVNLNASSPTALSIATMLQWRQIDNGSGAAAGCWFVGIDSNSYAWCWGYNSTGQLGDNSITNRGPAAVSVIGGKQWIKAIAAFTNTLALDSNSYAWAWGSGSVGRLGYNATQNSSSPVSVMGGKQFRLIRSANSVTTNPMYALDGNSYAWAWGNNQGGWGDLGDNTTFSRSSPVSVVGGKQWIALEVLPLAVVALDSNSYAWCWGGGTSGQLGDNTTLFRSSPVSVIGGKQWRKIATSRSGAGNIVVAIDSFSYAWAWGNNTYGVLGDNAITYKSSPVSVVGGKQFKDLTVTTYAGRGVVALDGSSAVWCWGYGTTGTIGDNTTNDRSSPTSVVGIGGKVISVGYGFPDAWAYTGSVPWFWGSNLQGSIGDKTDSNRSSPVSIVGAIKNFKVPRMVFGVLDYR